MRMKKIGIIALFSLNAVGGCSGENSIVSTVDDARISEGYVVIHAGRDRGAKVGDFFILSRGPYVTAHVVVFEAGDTTCKARVFEPYAKLSDVRAGDVALQNGSYMENKIGVLLFFAIPTILWAGFLFLFWRGYTRMSSYVAGTISGVQGSCL